MHANSLKIMQRLLTTHVPNPAGMSVVDVGACEKHNEGTYRPLCRAFDAYIGLDIEPGPNVDIVVPADALWDVLQRFDVAISGQCLEHTRWPWVWFENVCRLVKPGGLVMIIAPWQWREHRYPLDCWRILPDGMRALFEWEGIEPVEVGMSERDCFGVGLKPSEL